MKTNFLKHIIVSCLVVLLFSACNDLDQKPYNKFTDDGFWTSPERAMIVMNMAYNQMYRPSNLWNDEGLSDNLVYTRGTPERLLIRQGQATPSFEMFKEEWKWACEGIKTSNVFMQKVDLIPNFDSQVKNRMIAEIRFIRASLFFRMSNFWGDIPFFLQDITLDEAKVMVRTPRATVLRELHRELDEIIPYLPKRNDLPAAENGRITKAAAVMLKARMYLYEGNMEKVKEETSKLIYQQDVYGTYKLFDITTQITDQNGRTQVWSAFENMVLSEYEYNSEVILDYAAVEITKEWGELYSMVPNKAGSSYIDKSPTQSLVNAYLMKDGRTIAEAQSTSDYDESDPYKNRDPRMDATVVYNGFVWKEKDINTGKYGSQVIDTKADYQQNKDNFTKTGYYVRKYYDPNKRADYKQNNNIIMMRYADVLLMHAEACAETGTLTSDVWDDTIGAIRERAGFDASALIFPSKTKEDMIELVRNERRCELALEGLRYYDILRWNLGEKLLNGQIEGARFYNNDKYIPVTMYSYSSRDKLWSLPQVEMDNVPTLRPNNPGY